MRAILTLVLLAGCGLPMTVQVCTAYGFCASGYLDGDEVVTAAHNIDDGAEVRYPTRYRGGPAIVDVVDVEVDVVADSARIKTHNKGITEHETCEPVVGDEVIVIVQYSKSYRKRFSSRVLSVCYDRAYLAYKASPGDSGAVVVRRADKCIVGHIIEDNVRGAKVSLAARSER